MFLDDSSAECRCLDSDYGSDGEAHHCIDSQSEYSRQNVLISFRPMLRLLIKIEKSRVLIAFKFMFFSLLGGGAEKKCGNNKDSAISMKTEKKTANINRHSNVAF